MAALRMAALRLAMAPNPLVPVSPLEPVNPLVPVNSTRAEHSCVFKNSVAAEPRIGRGRPRPVRGPALHQR